MRRNPAVPATSSNRVGGKPGGRMARRAAMLADGFPPLCFRSIQAEAFFEQALAHGDCGRIVDAQDGNGRPRLRSLAAQPGSLPCEVFAPNVQSRVKEADVATFDRINAGDVWPFGGIAEQTREGEIRLVARPAVFERDDVVDLKWKPGFGFGKMAILTPCGCSLTNEACGCWADPAHTLPATFSESRARDFISSSRRPTCR